MLNVSEEYKNLINETYRPKCEPKITVLNGDGSVLFEWSANNIKDLNFKRTLDPLGRELPSMELTWTEIFTGKLNENAYPEKYNNAMAFLRVKLSFFQKLNTQHLWKEYYGPSLYWSTVYEKGTWGDVLERNENVEFPALFLDGKPVVEGNTVIWKARDFLYFLSEPVNFKTVSESIGLNFSSPTQYILQKSSSLWGSSSMFISTINDFIAKIRAFEEKNGTTLSKITLFDDVAKNLIVNHWQTVNAFFNFNGISAGLKNISEIFDETSVDTINAEHLYKYPEVKDIPKISIFSTKAYDYSQENPASSVQEVVSNAIGEPYNEDNKLNVYTFSGDEGYLRDRSTQVIKYMENSSIITFESLPFLHLETGDIIEVETNFYDKNDTPIFKRGIIVGMSFSYKGFFRQKTILHEVKGAQV